MFNKSLTYQDLSTLGYLDFTDIEKTTYSSYDLNYSARLNTSLFTSQYVITEPFRSIISPTPFLLTFISEILYGDTFDTKKIIKLKDSNSNRGFTLLELIEFLKDNPLYIKFVSKRNKNAVHKKITNNVNIVEVLEPLYNNINTIRSLFRSTVNEDTDKDNVKNRIARSCCVKTNNKFYSNICWLINNFDIIAVDGSAKRNLENIGSTIIAGFLGSNKVGHGAKYNKDGSTFLTETDSHNAINFLAYDYWNTNKVSAGGNIDEVIKKNFWLEAPLLLLISSMFITLYILIYFVFFHILIGEGCLVSQERHRRCLNVPKNLTNAFQSSLSIGDLSSILMLLFASWEVYKKSFNNSFECLDSINNSIYTYISDAPETKEVFSESGIKAIESYFTENKNIVNAYRSICDLIDESITLIYDKFMVGTSLDDIFTKHNAKNVETISDVLFPAFKAIYCNDEDDSLEVSSTSAAHMYQKILSKIMEPSLATGAITAVYTNKSKNDEQAFMKANIFSLVPRIFDRELLCTIFKDITDDILDNKYPEIISMDTQHIYNASNLCVNEMPMENIKHNGEIINNAKIEDDIDNTSTSVDIPHDDNVALNSRTTNSSATIRTQDIVSCYCSNLFNNSEYLRIPMKFKFISYAACPYLMPAQIDYANDYLYSEDVSPMTKVGIITLILTSLYDFKKDVMRETSSSSNDMDAYEYAKHNTFSFSKDLVLPEIGIRVQYGKTRSSK